MYGCLVFRLKRRETRKVLGRPYTPCTGAKAKASLNSTQSVIEERHEGRGQCEVLPPPSTPNRARQGTATWQTDILDVSSFEPPEIGRDPGATPGRPSALAPYPRCTLRFSVGSDQAIGRADTDIHQGTGVTSPGNSGGNKAVSPLSGKENQHCFCKEQGPSQDTDECSCTPRRPFDNRHEKLCQAPLD